MQVDRGQEKTRDPHAKNGTGVSGLRRAKGKRLA